MSKRKVIDFRVRPPYKKGLAFFQSMASQGTYDDMMGSGVKSSKSQNEQSVEELIKEMDEAGVELAVLPGRGSFGDQTEELLELAHQYPGRFVVFPFVDPLEGQKALDTVDQYVIHGEARGVAIEPGSQKNPFWFDDERAFPLYKKLEENNIPLLITYSARTIPVVDPNSVVSLERVAIQFPKLNLVLAHGAWPFTREIVAVAFKHRNVFIIPDVYGLGVPAAEDYIRAANSIIPDQLVYGSSYPVLPITGGVEAYEAQPFKNEEVRNKFFYQNAARILGIE